MQCTFTSSEAYSGVPYDRTTSDFTSTSMIWRTKISHLRINQKRETGSFGDNDSILCGQFVVGQALKVPLANRGRVSQHIEEVQLLGERDFPVRQLLFPCIQQLCSEVLVEGAAVGEKP